MDKRNDKTYEEIDLLRLARAVWKKMWLVVLVAILGAALAFSYTFFMITPQYTATALMYVNNSAINVGNTKLSITSSDIAASQSLVDTYTVILKTRGTLNTVREKAGVSYTYQQLSDMIEAGAVNSTEVFSIDVTCPDPREAELIANTIADVLPDRIAEIVDGSSVRIVDYAVVPSTISSPNYTKNTALGMILGLVLIIGILCVREIFDEKIHTEDDLIQRYSQPILAVIPDLTASGSVGGYYYGGYAKSGDKSN